MNTCDQIQASTSYSGQSYHPRQDAIPLSMIDENNSVSEEESSSGDDAFQIDSLRSHPRTPSPALPLEDSDPEEDLPPSPKPVKKAPPKKRTPAKKAPPPASELADDI